MILGNTETGSAPKNGNGDNDLSYTCIGEKAVVVEGS